LFEGFSSFIHGNDENAYISIVLLFSQIFWMATQLLSIFILSDY
jgi:hypothetical protein